MDVVLVRIAADDSAIVLDGSRPDIDESAKRRGELAVGYRQTALARQAPTRGAAFNPDKVRQVVLQPGDRVIVLAEH